VKPNAEIRAELTRVGTLPDGDIDLAGTALHLAAVNRPRVAIEPYRRHLEKLAGEVGAYAGIPGDSIPDLDLRVEALAQVIARRYGYSGEGAGDNDPEDANLMRVIDRRCGISVAIGILYLQAARALGWNVAGINFPVRFLLRLEHDGDRAIIDPNGGGRVVTPVDMRAMMKAAAGSQAEIKPFRYRELDSRGILLHLQNNVKVRLLHEDRLEEALDIVETMLIFAPAMTNLWREAGLLNVRLDNIKEAVVLLEEFLRRSKGDATRYRTTVLLQELRGRLG
jgi:regulator of sirC expression with transglutaminase-like and TPR domain